MINFQIDGRNKQQGDQKQSPSSNNISNNNILLKNDKNNTKIDHNSDSFYNEIFSNKGYNSSFNQDNLDYVKDLMKQNNSNQAHGQRHQKSKKKKKPQVSKTLNQHPSIAISNDTNINANSINNTNNNSNAVSTSPQLELPQSEKFNGPFSMPVQQQQTSKFNQPQSQAQQQQQPATQIVANNIQLFQKRNQSMSNILGTGAVNKISLNYNNKNVASANQKSQIVASSGTDNGNIQGKYKTENLIKQPPQIPISNSMDKTQSQIQNNKSLITGKLYNDSVTASILQEQIQMKYLNLKESSLQSQQYNQQNNNPILAQKAINYNYNDENSNKNILPRQIQNYSSNQSYQDPQLLPYGPTQNPLPTSNLMEYKNNIEHQHLQSQQSNPKSKWYPLSSRADIHNPTSTYFSTAHQNMPPSIQATNIENAYNNKSSSNLHQQHVYLQSAHAQLKGQLNLPSKIYNDVTNDHIVQQCNGNININSNKQSSSQQAVKYIDSHKSHIINSQDFNGSPATNTKEPLTLTTKPKTNKSPTSTPSKSTSLQQNQSLNHNHNQNQPSGQNHQDFLKFIDGYLDKLNKSNLALVEDNLNENINNQEDQQDQVVTVNENNNGDTAAHISFYQQQQQPPSSNTTAQPRQVVNDNLQFLQNHSQSDIKMDEIRELKERNRHLEAKLKDAGQMLQQYQSNEAKKNQELAHYQHSKKKLQSRLNAMKFKLQYAQEALDKQKKESENCYVAFKQVKEENFKLIKQYQKLKKSQSSQKPNQHRYENSPEVNMNQSNRTSKGKAIIANGQYQNQYHPYYELGDGSSSSVQESTDTLSNNNNNIIKTSISQDDFMFQYKNYKNHQDLNQHQYVNYQDQNFQKNKKEQPNIVQQQQQQQQYGTHRNTNLKYASVKHVQNENNQSNTFLHQNLQSKFKNDEFDNHYDNSQQFKKGSHKHSQSQLLYDQNYNLSTLNDDDIQQEM